MLKPDDLVLCAAPVGHIPLLDRLAPAREAGFAAISVLPSDIWTLEQAGMSTQEIVARVADAGLEIAEVDCIGHWLPSHSAAPVGTRYRDLLASLSPRSVIETAARIGARSVVVVEMMDVRPSLDEASQAFAEICDIAAEYDLPAHIEFLPFGGIPDLASAWAIVQAAGRTNGGLTVDSWHLFRSGSTLAQLAEIPGDRVMTVQIDDAPHRAPDDLFQETMTGRLLPGEGSFDLTGFIRTLDQIGCTAPIGVEVLSTETQTNPIDLTAHAWANAARSVLSKARKIK